MKNKPIKRYVTLLELMIALALTTVILSSLAYFYYYVDTINREMEVEQNKLFDQLALSTRLNDLLPKTVSPQTEKKDFFFYTTANKDSEAFSEQSSLVFTFQNGIKLNPAFSNHALAKLFIDKEHRLCLAVWPSPSRWEEFSDIPMKGEVLKKDVESLSFRFYIPPQKDREKIWKQAKSNVKLVEGFPLSEGGEWKDEWLPQWQQLPAIIEIKIVSQGESLTFSYPLPNTNFMVVY